MPSPSVPPGKVACASIGRPPRSLVRFSPTGDVASVQKTGLEVIRTVHPYGKTTPTLGRHTGFFSELFGNIGTVGGAGASGPTADNPNK